MTLIEQINADFMTAFKARQMEKKNFLGLVKSEIKNDEGRGRESSDDNVLKILTKLKKSLNENIDRGDESAKVELEFIEGYLPKMMTEAEIDHELITYLENDGMRNIGAIMGYFNKNFKGKVDNKVLNKLVKEELS